MFIIRLCMSIKSGSLGDFFRARKKMSYRADTVIQIQMFFSCIKYLIHFIKVEECFRRVADNKNDDDAREQGGHGGVAPVGSAGGPGHEAHVVAAGAGHRAEDQPVEDGQEQHGQQPHH